MDIKDLGGEVGQEPLGVPASPSGCQPSASAASADAPASSQSGIPNAGMVGFLRDVVANEIAREGAAGAYASTMVRAGLLIEIIDQLDALKEAAKPFARFLAAYDAKPLRNADEFYSIHVGTEWEAGLRFSDMRRLVAASGIEAATADETRSGSAEGESPVGDSRDAQQNPSNSND